MLPNAFADRLAGRLGALHAVDSALAFLRDGAVESTPLHIDRALHLVLRCSEERVVVEGIASARSCAEAHDDLAAAATVVERLCEAALGATAAGCGLSSPARDAALDSLLALLSSDHHLWRRCRAALDRRVEDALRTQALPGDVARRLAIARAAKLCGDDTLAARMAASMLLIEYFRTLVEPTPRESLLATMATLRGDIRLSARDPVLRIVLAHFIPLARPDVYDEQVASSALDNLFTWLEELRPMRRRWLEDLVAERRLPTLAGVGAEQYEEDLYRQELHDLLQRSEEAQRRREPAPELPEPVFIEQAFNDVVGGLAHRVLGVWAAHPEVVVQLLRVLARLRSFRLQAVPILRATMMVTAPHAESVDLAALDFARTFVSGLSAEDALRHRLLELRGGGLVEDVRSILETDTRIRALLEQIVRDLTRTLRVRGRALYVLLYSGPPEQELRRLMREAADGEPFQVEALLQYVVDTGAHSAFADLERVCMRLPSLPLPLRTLFFRAVSASAHVSAPRLLGAHVIEGDAEAVAALDGMGARGVLEELYATRTILENIRRVEELTHQRTATGEQETEHLERGVEEAARGDIALLEATRFGMRGHIEAVRFILAEADIALQLLERLSRFEALLAQVPGIQGRIDGLRVEAARLRTTLTEIAGQIDVCMTEIESLETDKHQQERALAVHTEELRRVQESLASASRRGAEARTRCESARRELSRLPNDEEHRNRIQRLASEADAALRLAEDVDREARALGSRAEAIPQVISELERTISECSAEIDHAEAEVQKLQRRLPPVRSKYTSTQERRHAADEELEYLRQGIANLRAEIDRIRQGAERTATQHRAKLDEVHHLQAEHLAAFKGYRRTAADALARAQVHRSDSVRLGEEMGRLDRESERLAKVVERNRECSGKELGDVDAAGRVAETSRRALQRARQEISLNTDLLTRILLVRLPQIQAARLVLQKVPKP